MINNTCESIQSNNYIGYDKTEISFEKIKFSMVETVAEHIRSTRFIKNLPGFNQLNDHDLKIIIQKLMINWFGLQIANFYADNDNYIIIKNGIQYSRKRMNALYGNVLTNLLEFHRCFNRLKLCEYELALFYTFIISRVDSKIRFCLFNIYIYKLLGII